MKYSSSVPRVHNQHRQFQRRMDIFEARMRTAARQTINGNLRIAAATYRARGEVPGFLTVEHELRWQQELAKHYRLVIGSFGKLALSAIRRNVPAERKMTMVESLIAEYIRREALSRARQIAETDFEKIRDAIAVGMEEGEGVAVIARRIRRVSNETPWRAALIARTETHHAATYGSIQSAREAEDELDMRLLKRWLPTQDGRTRPEHLAMAGHPAIPLDEKFNVGGELMDRPGDPGASPANNINCRCSIVYSEVHE